MRSGLWAVVLATLVMTSAQAYAQDAVKPLADTLIGDSKADYDTGKLLFADGDFAGAEVKFKSAFEKSHDPRLLWNMAACEKSQRHYARTVSLVRSYVAQGRAFVTSNDAADAQRLLDTLASLIVDVTINVNEPGAQVFVDDELAGTSPLARAVVVDLGKRKIAVKKDGFKDAAQEIEVGNARATTVAITLERLPSTQTQPPPPQGETKPPPVEQPPPPVMVTQQPPPPQVEPSTSPTATGTSPMKTVGFVVGGVGIAGVVVGVVAGAAAVALKGSANCDASGACDAGPLNNARGAAVVSDIGLIAGGALTAVGLVLILAAPKARAQSGRGLHITPMLGAGRAGVAVGGTF